MSGKRGVSITWWAPIWIFFLCVAIGPSAQAEWGFFGHQQINRLAVFTLPPKMMRFYKQHLDYLVKASVDPDRRRRAVKEEGPRHYIDLDVYEPKDAPQAPLYYKDAAAQWDAEFMAAGGIVPWHVYLVYLRLKEAFLLRDVEKILRNSAELGHYAADANVPLHTTQNYDGQLTGQHGIHSLWESRLPELFFENYDFWVGKANYIDAVQPYVWKAVRKAHQAVDSTLNLESKLYAKSGDQKYALEQRGKRTERVVSRTYAEQYHQQLNGMVERQMRASIRLVGSLWYTAWIDAGQPDLDTLGNQQPDASLLEQRARQLAEWRRENETPRPHE